MFALGFTYAVALIVAGTVAAFYRSGIMALAIASWYAVYVVSLTGSSEEWLRWTWLPAEMAAICVTVTVAALLILRDTCGLPVARRFWLRFGALVTSLSLVGLVWTGTKHNDWYWILLDLRAKAWQWVALSLLITIWLVPAKAHRDSVLLCWVALSHAVIGPMVHVAGDWQKVGYRVSVILACCFWLFSPISPVNKPDSRRSDQS